MRNNRDILRINNWREGDDFLIVPSERVANQIRGANIPSLASKKIIVSEQPLGMLTEDGLKRLPALRRVFRSLIDTACHVFRERINEAIQHIPEGMGSEEALKRLRMAITFENTNLVRDILERELRYLDIKKVKPKKGRQTVMGEEQHEQSEI